MQLDDQQKTEFINYYGNCPLIFNGDELVTVEDVRNPLTKDCLLIGRSWIKHPTKSTLNQITYRHWEATSFKDLEPYFIEPGYYQSEEAEATWISRKPERSMIKGTGRSNTLFIGVHPFTDKTKDIKIFYKEFDIYRIARIYHGLTYDHTKDLDESIKKFTDPSIGGNAFNIRLSPNIALVSHKTYQIPVVLYKLNPVGFYDSGRIYLAKDKEISLDTLQEETNIPVEVYES